MPEPQTSSPCTEPSAVELIDVLDRAQRSIVGFLTGLVGDGEHARDLLQDVLYDAWRAYRRAAPPFAGGDEEAIRRWLFHTAYCRAVSARRKSRLFRWESLDIPDAPEPQPHTGPQVPFEDRVAEREVVRAALASLGSEEAACLLLNVLYGFTSAEIAAIVGIAPEAAKKRLSRAKQRVRAAYLAEHRWPRG